jgi:hypothetical protein
MVDTEEQPGAAPPLRIIVLGRFLVAIGDVVTPASAGDSTRPGAWHAAALTVAQIAARLDDALGPLAEGGRTAPPTIILAVSLIAPYTAGSAPSLTLAAALAPN